MKEKLAHLSGALRAMLSVGSPKLSGGGSIPCFGMLVNCLQVLREDFPSLLPLAAGTGCSSVLKGITRVTTAPQSGKFLIST